MAQNTGLWFILCTLEQIWAITLDPTIATGVNEYQPQKSTLDIIKKHKVAQNYSLLSVWVNDSGGDKKIVVFQELFTHTLFQFHHCTE